jgi:two-component system sensor histidine kinase AlgZ
LLEVKSFCIGGTVCQNEKLRGTTDSTFMPSINQTRQPGLLPDFENLGVMLRVLILVSAMTVVAAALKSADWPGLWAEFLRLSVLVQPVLLVSLLACALISRLLHRLSYPGAVVAIVAMVLVLTTLIFAMTENLMDLNSSVLPRFWFFSASATIFLLAYFNLRNRALSPAITESRLQALQARIRPHFLFNSINAVLSLMRAEPKRAERALEDLADLFRVLMGDNRDLVPVEAELKLCRQYLDIEALRLGTRLQVEWHTDNAPMDALIPPLVLQPLIENAVYHGIEPGADPGVIAINVFKVRNELHMVIKNPYRKQGDHHAGNKMAVGNIRERLALHFDAEASMHTRVSENRYEVQIIVPYVRPDE